MADSIEKEVRKLPKEDSEGEEKRKKKRATTSVTENPEQAARRLRLAEAEARRSLDRIEGKRKDEPPQKLHEMDPEHLRDEYDHWAHLEAKLRGTERNDLLSKVAEQKEAVRKELLFHGVIPEEELHALAEAPVTYSAELLNDLAQSTLGVEIKGDATGDAVELRDGVIHVPSGPLTLDHTLEIARQLTRGAGSELLRGKEKELVEFGQKIRKLAVYLAGQRKIVNGKEISIFEVKEDKDQTAARQQAIVELYKAGTWLSGLGGVSAENDNGQEKQLTTLQNWGELEEKGKAFVGKLNKNDETDILEFLLGKSLAKATRGRIPTTYERLLQHHGGSPQALREWLTAHGPRMVRLLAPHIAESFAAGGKATQAIRQEWTKGAGIVPNVIFERAREKTEEVGLRLPPEVVRNIEKRFDISFETTTRHLLTTARKLKDSEYFKNLPPQEQLEALNELVQSFQATGETTGDSVKGYKLADVFDNVDAEMGCSVRAYLLAWVMEEAYASDDTRPVVVANTMLLPNGKNGVIGHTRLMVVHPKNKDQVFIVDPSVKDYHSKKPSITFVNDPRLVHQVQVFANSGKSRVIEVEDPTSHDSVSHHQTIGDAMLSQESNIVANIAAAGGGNSPHRTQMLQLALQRDPNNQVALLHLAAIARSEEEREAYVARLVRVNPALADNPRRLRRLREMLAHPESSARFQVALAAGGGFGDPGLKFIVDDFYRRNGIPAGTALNTPGLNLSPGSLTQLRDKLTAVALQTTGGATYAADMGNLNGVIAEIEAAYDAAEKREKDPNNIWKVFQEQMREIEARTSAPAGVESLLGVNQQELQMINTQLFPLLQDQSRRFAATNPPGTPNPYQEMYDQLYAEYNVRTAAHDVFYYGQTGGDQNFQQMAAAANRFVTGEMLRMERTLPGAALVRRLYEQACTEWFLTHDTIGAGDQKEITDIVNDRFDALSVQPGILSWKYPVGADLHRLEVEVAKNVGKNLFFLKTRIAHFVALGKPEPTAPGLAIAKSPWDFVATVYDPYDWRTGRFGFVPEHTQAILNHIGGREAFNRLLAVQDHDSSIWRTPAYIKQFDENVLDPSQRNKQALFMRLYTTLDVKDPIRKAEKLAEAEEKLEEKVEATRKAAMEEYLHANPGDKKGAKAYVDQKAHEAEHQGMQDIIDRQTYPTPEELIEDIIKYVPEELANLYKGDAVMEAIVRDPAYKRFILAITAAREQCSAARDGAYTTFTLGNDPDVLRIYNALNRFLSPRVGELANPKAFFNGQQNPLYQRVWSLSDAPFEKMDTQFMERKLGGQSVGREMGNLQAGYEALGAVEAFMMHPSEEALEKVKGKFLYRGWGLDEQVRDLLFEGNFRFNKEDDVLRLLMPGLDRAIAWIKGGGSERQRAYGKYAESDDTVELLEKIAKAEAEGLITPKEAAKLRSMANMLYLARLLPMAQMFIAITIVAMIRTAFDPKALTA